MKTIITILVSLLITVSNFAQQATNYPISFDQVRTLDEINQASVPDAYPWISEDGLTIYFNSLQGDEIFTLMFKAERETIADEFSNIQLLDVNIAEHDNFSPVLSPNGLELYFTKRDPYEVGVYIYKATRNSTDEEFSNPTEIEIIGIDDVDGKIYFMTGVSFTPDKSKMYAYHSYQGKRILIFDKTDENQYTVSDTLDIPVGYSPGSGATLSPNGLKYYLTLKDEQTDDQFFYFYQRNDLSEPFTDLYIVENEQIYENETIYQPHINSDFSVLVYTVSTGGYYSNDLYIAQNLPSVGINNIQNTTKTYPNPASDYFIIETNNKISKNSFVLIYSLSGILMQKTLVNTSSNKVSVNIRNLKSGTYIYKIETLEGTETGKIAID